jgi:hypothetical protein
MAMNTDPANPSALEPLDNPYDVGDDGSLLRPNDNRFRFTSVCFEHFLASSQDLGLLRGHVAQLFAKFMIRRGYAATCDVTPAPCPFTGKDEPFKHRIGASMKPATTVQLKMTLSPTLRHLHDTLIAPFLSLTNVSLNAEGHPYINGKSQRILNLIAINPILALAAKILHVRIKKPDEGNSLHAKQEKAKGKASLSSSSKATLLKHPGFASIPDPAVADHPGEIDEDGNDVSDSDKMENPDLGIYTELYRGKQYLLWMRKLMEDIWVGTEGNEATRKMIFETNPNKPMIHPSKAPGRHLVHLLCRTSPRLSALMANVARQVDDNDEKAIIFAQNPWEQQLYAVMLRLLGYHSAAYLSVMKADAKNELIVEFKRDLARWHNPAIHTTHSTELEVLVLSYHMNSGLNLHNACNNMHAPSPPPSWSIWIQSIGRICRFGQQRDCTVMLYYIPFTYNCTQMGTFMANALPTLAAYSAEAAGSYDPDYDYMNPIVKLEELDHWDGVGVSGLVRKGTPEHAEVEKAGRLITDLTLKDKYIRLFAATLGVTIQVDQGKDVGEQVLTYGTPIIDSEYSLSLATNSPRKAASSENPESPSSASKKAPKPKDLARTLVAKHAEQNKDSLDEIMADFNEELAMEDRRRPVMALEEIEAARKTYNDAAAARAAASNTRRKPVHADPATTPKPARTGAMERIAEETIISVSSSSPASEPGSSPTPNIAPRSRGTAQPVSIAPSGAGPKRLFSSDADAGSPSRKKIKKSKSGKGKDKDKSGQAGKKSAPRIENSSEEADYDDDSDVEVVDASSKGTGMKTNISYKPI